MLTNEQLLAAHKANVDTLLSLSATSLDAVEKLAALNLEVTKAALGEASAKAQAALSVKDVQELFAMQGDVLQPTAEKSAAYARKVYDIAAGVQAELAKAAEAGFADVQSKVTALVDTAVKNAPAGSENAVTLMKAAVAAANDTFENVQKAAKQAVGAAEANFATISSSVVAAKPAGRAKRAA
ncbi:MAG: phasin family protein [Piscinibacter sp.]|nr:phasin family protein [Piscinibacter sp.]